MTKNVKYIANMRLANRIVLAQAGYFELYKKNEVSNIGDINNK